MSAKLVLLFLGIYVLVSTIQIVQAVADFVFEQNLKRLTKRILLAIIWPLALLSRKGWKFIGKSIKGKNNG